MAVKQPRRPQDSFEVVVERVIGTVDIGLEGDFTPHEAAFLLIARDGDEGRYSFPDSHGGRYHINIVHEGPS